MHPRGFSLRTAPGGETGKVRAPGACLNAKPRVVARVVARVVKAALTLLQDAPAMVSRTRFRSILTALALYAVAGLLIGYFGVHAFTGSRGLNAKEDLQQQMVELSAEVGRLKAERAEWDRRVALLRSSSLDPDMLDERARAVLHYVHPRDLLLTGRTSPAPPPAASAAGLRANPANP
jgi:cell division protein FtsB